MILGTNSTFQIDLRDMVPRIINIQSVLKGDGAAFNLLDMTRMYKDVEGKIPAGEVGDTVRRVNSYVDDIYLYDREGNGAVIESYNGLPVLRFGGTLFEIAGFDPSVPQPVIAHATVKGRDACLYWYNREGTGYGPRKWGVIVRNGQYRTFHNNGSIDVMRVDEWDTYHDVYLNRVGNEIALDGSTESYPNTRDEVYDPSDNGFRLGGYGGTTSESFRGIVTYFVISGDSLDDMTLRTFADKHRERLGI